MIAALWFCAGAVTGIIGTIGIGVAILHWPVAERDREPVRFSAIGSGRSMTTGPASTFDFLQRRLK
jgi:hypothetical protein